MDENEIELYGDPRIASRVGKVSIVFKIFYLFVLLWGLSCLFLFWNGATGWLDRGYWFQLEQAANTTFPFRNADK